MDSNHRPLPCQGSALDQLSYGPTCDGCAFILTGNGWFGQTSVRPPRTTKGKHDRVRTAHRMPQLRYPFKKLMLTIGKMNDDRTSKSLTGGCARNILIAMSLFRHHRHHHHHAHSATAGVHLK